MFMPGDFRINSVSLITSWTSYSGIFDPRNFIESPAMTSFLNYVPTPIISVSDLIFNFPVPDFAKSYGLSTAMHFIFLANHDIIGVLIAF